MAAMARVFLTEAREEDPMKRILAVLALLIGLGAGVASAQTRVSVSLSFGAPFVAYRPYHRTHGYHRYRVYDPRPTIIVVRPYRPARLIVVRHGVRRHHRRW
jgi:hypothetical protein